MRIPHLISVPLLAALGAACSTSPGPVPVVAEAGELLQIAGKWQGHYDSPVVGRSGSIVFELEAGADTAHGEVTMIPRGWNRPLGPAEDPAAAARDAPIPEVLQIRFVRVEYGVVSGTLQPYNDPDCGCPVYTTFTGRLQGDTIEGKFTARPGHGPAYQGSWRVERKREGG
ncbi:MAG: hypothetical protein JSV86_14600 [Gemmatimonadota bacterium]|nr:MAG: hypothetical protein JSV86_14600 [Gemmatimonadota bacterium]